MSLIFLALACVFVLFWIRILRPLYDQWLYAHPSQGIALGVLLACVFGAGEGFGLQNLFWHEDYGTQLVAGASLASLALMFWALNLSINRLDARAAHDAFRRRWRIGCNWGPRVPSPSVLPERRLRLVLSPARYRWYLWIMFAPLGSLLTFWSLRGLGDQDEYWYPGSHLFFVVGAWGAFGGVYLALCVLEECRWAVWWARRRAGVQALLVLVMAIVAAMSFLMIGRLTPVMAAAFLLLITVLIVYLFALLTRPSAVFRVVCIFGFAVLVGVSNGRPFKLTYPGLEDYYPRDQLADFQQLPTEREESDDFLIVAECEQPNSEASLDGEASGQWHLRIRELRGAGNIDDPNRKGELALLEESNAMAESRYANRAVACAYAFYLARSRYRLRFGDFEGAIADAGDAVRSNPPSVPARNQLAAALIANFRNPQKIESKLKEFPQLAEDTWEHWATTGFMQYHMAERPEELTEAANSYSKAIQRHRDFRLGSLGERIQLHVELSEVYDRLGDTPKARATRDSEVKLRLILRDLRRDLLSNPNNVVQPLLRDRECLRAWARAITEEESGPYRKPVLVVIATSGGGIAAAYWTALCLTHIEKQCPEFPRRIRVVTGASGGMFGAGVYVARHPAVHGTPQPADTPGDVAKDCLTPIARRLLLVDIPSILFPYDQSNDRGRTLDCAWVENTAGTTSKTFAELRDEEGKGRRPSLIVSPMLVEDSRFLLISNLDLGGLGGHFEFFKYFGLSHEKFTLGTALRMNASFPYVSPAVNLPTKIPRRVVDAGFLDNYGVSLACAWIERHKGWLAAKTNGIVLIQIRAYPTPDESAPPDPMTRQSGWEFLGTPIEGVLGVRSQTMWDRNRDLVRGLAQWFNFDTPNFFRTFELQCSQSVPLGWSLTRADRDRLDREVAMQANNIIAIRDAIRSPARK